MIVKSESWIEKNREILKDCIPVAAPFKLNIEISSLCNIKCNYCIHSAVNDQSFFKGLMRWDAFVKIINDAKRFPVKIKKIDLTGIGEPLCNKDIARMISYIKKADVCEKVEFITNGLLFTPEISDAVIEAGIDNIRISLQGLNSNKYKEICGVKINFEKFIENLAYLYKNKKQSNIYMKIANIALPNKTGSNRNLNEIFGDLCDGLFIENIMPVFHKIDYNMIDTKIATSTRFGDNYKYINVCSKAFYNIRVLADGNIVCASCDPDKKISFGNISELSLIDAWQSSQRNNLLKMMLENKRINHPICSKCQTADDILNESDLLDPYTEELLNRFSLV